MDHAWPTSFQVCIRHNHDTSLSLGNFYPLASHGLDSFTPLYSLQAYDELENPCTLYRTEVDKYGISSKYLDTEGSFIDIALLKFPPAYH